MDKRTNNNKYNNRNRGDNQIEEQDKRRVVKAISIRKLGNARLPTNVGYYEPS